MLSQFRQMRKMGGMSSLMGMIPGLGALKEKLGEIDVEGSIRQQEAIIFSMTPTERRNPGILKASRKRRIATGAGTHVSEVNKLLKQFQQMQGMMKKVGKMDKKSLMRQVKSMTGKDINEEMLPEQDSPDKLGLGNLTNFDDASLQKLLK